MKIKHTNKYPIAKVYLVGYGREQMRQYVCYSCNKLYFDVNGNNPYLCDDCLNKDGEVLVDSDIEQYTEIIGFKQKFDTYKKRSNYNYAKVAKRDNYTCQYCGYSPRLFVDFKPMHVDHIKPFSMGGNNSMNNLVLACSDCNLHLSNKIFRDYHEKKCFIVEWRKNNDMPYTEKHWITLSHENIIDTDGDDCISII